MTSFWSVRLFCLIISARGVNRKRVTVRGGGILPNIASGVVHRAMYLPPMHNTRICPEMEGGGIIYLNHISSCAVRWINDAKAQAVCSLTAEGLRALDIKLQNHFFRPKAAQLMLSR